MMFARSTALLPVVLAATFVGASVVPRCDGSGSSGSGSSGSGSSGSGSSGSGSSGSGSSGSGSSGSAPAGNCSTGPVQCCNTTYDTKDHSTDLLAGLLGLSLGDITGLLALQCSPINVLGLGGVQCGGTAVCCDNNSAGGLVNIGCVPVVL